MGSRAESGKKRHRQSVGPIEETVLFVNDAFAWPQELIRCVTRQGYVALQIDDLGVAPSFLQSGGVKAVLVGARPLGGKDLLVLRQCREASPGTAVVVATTAPSQPDLKRAFESGATAFLSWPASPEAVQQALCSGGQPPAGPLRP